ncbi:MAG: CoA transferase, partial [Blastopirellula sp.]
MAESLITDSRFENNTLRSSNREELRDIIQTLFSTLNAEEIIKKLEAAQIAFANVNDMQDVW